MADVETLEKVCAAQRGRVRSAARVHACDHGDLPRQAGSSCRLPGAGPSRQRLRAWLRPDVVAATSEPAEDARLRLRAAAARSAAAGAEHDWLYSEAHALPWLEQVASGVPPGAALKLMHAAFQPATEFHELQPLLCGMPAWLQALALQACAPCVDAHGKFDATVTTTCAARTAASILHDLPALTKVSLCVQGKGNPPSNVYDTALKSLLQASCAPEHLRTLSVSLVTKSLTRSLTTALTTALAQASELESLQIASRGCGDSDTAAALARGLCGLPHLTRLHLSGINLAAPLAVTFSECMAKLAALRELHVDDGEMCHMYAVSIARAANTLPALTSLYFGGFFDFLLFGVRQLCVCIPTPTTVYDAEQMVSAVSTAPQLRALSICEADRLASSWGRLGHALEANSAGFSQLTRLALVRCVRCEDMLGLGAALACMPALQSLNIGIAGHAYGVTSQELCDAACDTALPRLLRGLSIVNRLTELVLAGLDIPKASSGDSVAALAALTSLQNLALCALEHCTHSWTPAAAGLAAAMRSGAQLTALRDLDLLSWLRHGDELVALSEAVGSLSGLKSLKFAISCLDASHVIMAGLSSSLQRLTGLRRLYLRAENVTGPGLRLLAPALQHLTALTELRVQYEGLSAAMLWEAALALVVPSDDSALGQKERLRNRLLCHRHSFPVGCGPGLLRLKVLDVSLIRLLAGVDLDVELLKVVVDSLLGLEEVRVGPLLGDDLSAFSDWGVKVTGGA